MVVDAWCLWVSLPQGPCGQSKMLHPHLDRPVEGRNLETLRRHEGSVRSRQEGASSRSTRLLE